MKNRIEVEGYLGNKPEQRFLPSGSAVADARLAETYLISRSNGKEDRQTNWHALKFYGDLASPAAKLEKGLHVFIVGSYECREWTAADQRKRSTWELNVSSFHVIASRGSNSEVAPVVNGKPLQEVTDADWPA